jgi:phage terminase large subunit-like protein
VTNEMKELLLLNYEAFLRKSHQEEQGAPLGDDPYTTSMCDGFDWLVKKGGRTLVVNLPPRHGKTSFGVVYLVAWLLANNPRLQIIIITHNGELSEQITYRIRQIMRLPFYLQICRTRLQKDRQKVGHFVTNFGGAVIATSINGLIAGLGADYIFADDLLSLRDANDPGKVEAVNRIFDAEITSRLNRPSEGRIVVNAHRLHDHDLSAHLKGANKTRHIVLPLVAERRTVIQLSTGPWIREKGELLRAGSHTKAQIEKLRLNAIPSFAHLYQQGVGGSKLRLTEDQFKSYNSLLPVGPILISVDTAVKEGPNNSFTVMQVWAPRANGFYLIEQFRAQCRLAESIHVLRKLMSRHRPNGVLIEGRANGTNLIDAIRRRTRTPVVEMDPGRKSKVERLARHVPLIRKRPIFLPEGFLERDAFIAEFLGRSDSTDQMDGLSQMLEFVSNNAMPPQPPPRALFASAGTIRGAARSSSSTAISATNGIARALVRRGI